MSARAEDGLTIVEVVVAGLLLVVSGLGVLGIVDAATRNTFRAEQSQVVANVLQAEMEKLKQLPYSEVALTELPVHSGGQNDPDSRVANTTFFYTGRDGTGLKPLVFNGAANGAETIEGGTVESGPEPFQVENVKGEIYRYVVWDTCPSSLCQDGRYLKRVIVAAKLDPTAPGGAARRYQEVQGQVVDPAAEPSTFPGQQPGGSDTVPWTLWLTDTSCDQPTRQPLPTTDGDHQTHNTRGECEDGLQEGVNEPGAPDLMWYAAPPLPGEPVVDPDIYDYKYDYATDLSASEGADTGLQLLVGGDCGAMTQYAGGVATAPDTDETLFQKVHRWLSPPIPVPAGSDDLLLTGGGTLTLWTQMVGASGQQARLCVWLFVRTETETTVTDTLLYDLSPPPKLYFDHLETTWPHGGLDRVSVPLSFGHAGEGGAVVLPEGSRLGLALAVDDDSPNGLAFHYDDVSFESRLQVETTGALPPGVGE